jgi:hypothetical protein
VDACFSASSTLAKRKGIWLGMGLLEEIALPGVTHFSKISHLEDTPYLSQCIIPPNERWAFS